MGGVVPTADKPSMASPKADSIAAVPLVGSLAAVPLVGSMAGSMASSRAYSKAVLMVIRREAQKVVLKALPKADWMAYPLFYHIWEMQRKKGLYLYSSYSLLTILHKAALHQAV
jgi:hypothetical protein